MGLVTTLLKSTLGFATFGGLTFFSGIGAGFGLGTSCSIFLTVFSDFGFSLRIGLSTGRFLGRLGFIPPGPRGFYHGLRDKELLELTMW